MIRTRWIPAALGAVLALSTATACTKADTGGDEAPHRKITHAMGVAEIKANPERVVVLDTGELDTVAALGIKPVGMVRADVNTEVVGYLKDTVAGAEIVGTIQDPNLEKIASLKPDLILGSKLRVADKYDQLNAIAPTVLAEKVGVTWKQNFLLFGDALGKKDQATAALAAYEAEAKELGAKIGDPAKMQVSMVRFTPQGKGVRLYTPGSFIGTILTDVGLGRPASQQDAAKTFVEAGPEELSQGDGDVIFYASYGPKNGTKQDQVTNGELWKSLKAVQNQKAFEVSDDLWYLGIGLGAAHEVLNELSKYLNVT